MKLTLYRTVSGQFGTFGVLCHDEIPLCNTLEEPWKDNHRNISCIPTGEYKCVQYSGTKHKNVWEVLKIPNRSNILIHAGNTLDDIEGCILVGKGIGEVNHYPAVTSSQAALKYLRTYLPKKFTLEIRGIATARISAKPRKLSWFERFFKKGEKL